MKRQLGAVITTTVFLGIIGICTVASLILPQNVFSQTENRYLQTKPEFTSDGLWDGSFGTKYETYLSDQFPGRNAWIGLKVTAERIQLKQDVNGVYFGKDGYLIEKFDMEDIVTEQLEKNLKAVSSMMESAAARYGKDHVRVMLLPSASTVMKDKLPEFAAPFDQHYVEEQLNAVIDAGMLVSMDEVFRGREQEPVFYKTDHHWTTLGAYYGYGAWAESLGIKPWAREEFSVEQVSDSFLGTVQSKVNVTVSPDTIELYYPKKAASYKVFYDGSEAAADTLYSLNALEGKDKYAVFLDGNHALTEIKNQMVQKERKGTSLLVVKDSFAHSFVPFAVNHFETVYMLDLRYYNGSVSRFMEDYPVTDFLLLYQIPGFAKEKTVSKLR